MDCCYIDNHSVHKLEWNDFDQACELCVFGVLECVEVCVGLGRVRDFRAGAARVEECIVAGVWVLSVGRGKCDI